LSDRLVGHGHRLQFPDGGEPSEFEGVIAIGFSFDVLPGPGVAVGVGDQDRSAQLTAEIADPAGGRTGFDDDGDISMTEQGFAERIGRGHDGAKRRRFGGGVEMATNGVELAEIDGENMRCGDHRVPPVNERPSFSVTHGMHGFFRRRKGTTGCDRDIITKLFHHGATWLMHFHAKTIVGTLALLILPTFCCAEPMITVSPKLRVIIETDAGGDPDDEASLVRFLLYSNEWDVEGIIADRPRTNNQGTRTGLELCRKILRAYGDCLPNLQRHKPDYPSHDALERVTVAGYDDVADGENLILAALRKDDSRPIWFANWGSDSGTTSSMKRALDRLRRDVPPEEYKLLVSRIRVTRNAEKLGDHCYGIGLFVDTRNPNGWYRQWARLTNPAIKFDLKRYVTSVGPLGACYPAPKEGDSLAFIYLIPTGLSDPDEPTWGGWAGRYSPLTAAVQSSDGKMGPKPREGFYWADATDVDSMGKPSRDQTLARWAVAIQNDFRARMQWSVTPNFKDANHEPIVVVQGDRSRDVLRVNARAGKPLSLSAEGTSDPDGDQLNFRWSVYADPGTYRHASGIRWTGSDSSAAILHLPADASGQTIHVLLEVTDTGTPSLTRYRRIVVTTK
jgi:hypothetical protein